MPPVSTNTIPVACFAPPLTDELLDHYAALADAAPGPVRDAMGECLAAVRAWWDLPESTRQDVERWTLNQPPPNLPPEKRERFAASVAGRPKGFTVVPLEESHVKALWDLVPWRYEIEAMQGLFDGIDPVGAKELRDAAFHLLWFVTELERDREPVTQDKL
jgi:hypothetical protein